MTEVAAASNSAPAQEQTVSAASPMLDTDRWPNSVCKDTYKGLLSSFEQAAAQDGEDPLPEKYVREYVNVWAAPESQAKTDTSDEQPKDKSFVVQPMSGPLPNGFAIVHPILVSGADATALVNEQPKDEIDTAHVLAQVHDMDINTVYPEQMPVTEAIPSESHRGKLIGFEFIPESMYCKAQEQPDDSVTYSGFTGTEEAIVKLPPSPLSGYMATPVAGAQYSRRDKSSKRQQRQQESTKEEQEIIHSGFLTGGLRRNEMNILSAYSGNHSQVFKGNTPKKKKNKEIPHSAPLRSAKAQDYLQKLLKHNQGKDGDDHINTSSAAKTGLGRMLQINAHMPFNHPDLGSFKSLGGLWYYVSSGCEDETFRALSGYACHVRGQTIGFREIEGFKHIIAEAAWMKASQNPELFDMLASKARPFKHYVLVGEMRVHQTSSVANWYVPILEEIARVARLHTEGQVNAFPDFSFLDRIDELAFHERSKAAQYNRRSYNVERYGRADQHV